MKPRIKLTDPVLDLVRCPVCRAPVGVEADALVCTGAGCVARFPIVDGVPVLINEATSLFDITDFTGGRNTTHDLAARGWFKRTLDRLTPSISRNVKGAGNYRRLAELLLSATPSPRVLVLGGSVLGQGMESLVANQAIELVESDVALGPRTALICDAHGIPFTDGAFDGVILQAVLEHVLDPHRVVQETHRVLKPDGLVYAETPFIQQVHMAPHDFTRFTHLGHRRLFRWFDEVDSGAVCGPGMALAWAYQSFLLSFTASRRWRRLIRVFAAWTAFWLKHLDGYLVDKPGALDAASGYFFMGRKADRPLPDRDLIELYRGALCVS